MKYPNPLLLVFICMDVLPVCTSMYHMCAWSGALGWVLRIEPGFLARAVSVELSSPSNWELTSTRSKLFNTFKILLYRLLLAAGPLPAHPSKMLGVGCDRFPTERQAWLS